MNDNKGARVLNRIFQIVFFICMAITFVGTIVYGYVKESRLTTGADGKPTYIRTYFSTKAHLLIYLAAFLMLVMFCVLYYLSTRQYRLISHGGKMSSEKKFRIILFSGIGIILLIQLYFGAKLKINPISDLLAVNDFASSFAKTNSFDTVRELIASGENDYMARYPNNFTIMMILALVYRVAYLVFGYIPRLLPVVMNVFAINLSLLFAVLIARHLFGRRKAVYTLCLLALFAPFYAYTPFYYTDSLSMPFGVFSIYLFILAMKSDNSKVKKYVMLVIAGAVIFIGFKVKGSLIVLLPAVLIYALLKCKIKQFACVALAVVIGFGSFFVMYKVGYKAVGLVSEEQAERLEYPYTHWVMMGLKGRGGYNKNDSVFTSKIEGKENKQKANIEVIKKRLNTYIENGKLGEHFIVKASWMWGDGTYFIPGHISNYVKRCFLHEFFLRDGKYYFIFYGYSNAFQLVLLLMILASLLKGILRPKIDYTVLLKSIVFAVFVFLLIWEGRSRYLYNLTPIFIILAADGISFTTESVTKLFRKIRKKDSDAAESTADPEAVEDTEEKEEIPETTEETVQAES